MNVVFADSISASCFADMLKMKQHKENLLNFLAWKMTGYSSDKWQLEPKAESRSVCEFTPINGDSKHRELQIYVAWRNIEQTPNGLYTKDIDWMIVDYPADCYGRKLENAEPRNGMRGGFINSGTFEEPNWSSHT